MRTFLRLFCLLISPLVYANEPQNQEILNEILETAQTSIEKVEGENVFLKPEKVCLYQGNIYLNGDHGEAIRLPHLFSMGNRLFLKTDDKMEKIWICMNCTKVHHYEPTRCENCPSRDFLVRYKATK